MECTNCYSTMFLTISAKCYDMCFVGYGEKGITGHVPPEIGLGSDPNCVNFSYCMQCGKIHGDFPIQLPVELRPPLVQSAQESEELVSEILQEFYETVMSGSNKVAAELIFRKVIKFLQPSDATILLDAWSKFEDLRCIYPKLPEFDETINWAINRYKNIKVKINMRVC